MSEKAQNQLRKGNPVFMPVLSGALQRKCACGNHTMAGGECEECSKKKRFCLLTKLRVNEPGDIYEQEADRIADQVMAMQANSKVGVIPRSMQRLSGEPAGQFDTVPASVSQALPSPGRPLEPALWQDMGQRFGYDFSRVRVHTGAAAEQSARDVNARAFTSGYNVVFGAGEFAPASQTGRRLIAHELTHVIQQDGSVSRPLYITGISTNPLIQRYISPLDILDYLGIGIDVAERIYLAYFYEGSDRELQLALNLIFMAMDVVFAALPGVGGGGLALRAGHGAMALVWDVMPPPARRRVVIEVAGGMAWSTRRTAQFINHLMRREGEGNGEEDTREGGGGRSSRRTSPAGDTRYSDNNIQNVVDKHTEYGDENMRQTHAWLFFADDLQDARRTIENLIEEADGIPMRYQSDTGNYERVIESIFDVGFNGANRRETTNLVTIITDECGNLVTMFPGLRTWARSVGP